MAAPQHDIFLSYNRKDTEFMRRLREPKQSSAIRMD